MPFLVSNLVISLLGLAILIGHNFKFSFFFGGGGGALSYLKLYCAPTNYKFYIIFDEKQLTCYFLVLVIYYSILLGF